MRGRTQDAIPQHPTVLRLGLRGAQLEVRCRPAPGHGRWHTQQEAIGACGGTGSGAEEAAPRQPRGCGRFLLQVMGSSMHTPSFPSQSLPGVQTLHAHPRAVQRALSRLWCRNARKVKLFKPILAASVMTTGVPAGFRLLLSTGYPMRPTDAGY